MASTLKPIWMNGTNFGVEIDLNKKTAFIYSLYIYLHIDITIEENKHCQGQKYWVESFSKVIWILCFRRQSGLAILNHWILSDTAVTNPVHRVRFMPFTDLSNEPLHKLSFTSFLFRIRRSIREYRFEPSHSIVVSSYTAVYGSFYPT